MQIKSRGNRIKISVLGFRMVGSGTASGKLKSIETHLHHTLLVFVLPNGAT